MLVPFAKYDVEQAVKQCVIRGPHASTHALSSAVTHRRATTHLQGCLHVDEEEDGLQDATVGGVHQVIRGTNVGIVVVVPADIIDTSGKDCRQQSGRRK